MTVRDPVCGMNIEPQSAFAKREHMGQTFYFCSQSCVDQFDKNPHRYMTTSATTGFNPERPFIRVELALSGPPSNKADSAIEPAVRALPGINNVKVNLTAGKLDVEYDAGKVNLTKIAEIVRSAGYPVGAQTRIGIENLRCASCVQFIEDELKSTPGVLGANVNVATQEATVDYLPEKTTMSQLNEAIEIWSYKPHPATSDAPADKQDEAHAREYRKLMNKFWFAAAVSLPVLLTAYYQFVPFLRDLSMDTLRWLWGATALLTLPVMFWSGSDFFTDAWQAFKHRSANMNTLTVKGGYSPDVIVVQKGRPVRLTFTRQESAACSERILFPDFNKNAALPEGEQVTLEFTPDHPGEYVFQCQMGMLRGKLIVE